MTKELWQQQGEANGLLRPAGEETRALLNIAILGTRGIPNRYGGFEQAVSQLAPALVQRGHAVTVYNSHNHPHQQNNWRGARIQHCYDPESWQGTVGQFVYDLNCIRHARRQPYDVWLFMGYTSSSVWHRLFSRSAVIVSNMDGMEWQRAKYSKPVQGFLRRAEALAAKHSDFLLADSSAIKAYLDAKYGVNAACIPYGATRSADENEEALQAHDLTAQDYYLLVARMEPENNVGTVLEGFCHSKSQKKFLVIGNTANRYGKMLKERFCTDDRIRFAGPVFDQSTLRCLRRNAALYFHGHSVGGTNPSLLDAMGDGVPVAAHDNVYNHAVLGSDAFYFRNATDVQALIEREANAETRATFVRNNLQKTEHAYNWESVADRYEAFLRRCCRSIGATRRGFAKQYAR